MSAATLDVSTSNQITIPAKVVTKLKILNAIADYEHQNVRVMYVLGWLDDKGEFEQLSDIKQEIFQDEPDTQEPDPENPVVDEQGNSVPGTKTIRGTKWWTGYITHEVATTNQDLIEGMMLAKNIL